MAPSVLIHIGLIATILGAASLFRPLKLIAIRTRRRGMFVLSVGLLTAGIGWALPVQEARIGVSRTRLDEFAPVYQFREVHTVRVAASRNQAYQAIKSITADEIPLFRTLTWIRRLGRS